MAAYRRVYDSRHLQADCQELGIEYGLALPFSGLLTGSGHFKLLKLNYWGRKAGEGANNLHPASDRITTPTRHPSRHRTSVTHGTSTQTRPPSACTVSLTHDGPTGQTTGQRGSDPYFVMCAFDDNNIQVFLVVSGLIPYNML